MTPHRVQCLSCQKVWEVTASQGEWNALKAVFPVNLPCPDGPCRGRAAEVEPTEGEAVTVIEYAAFFLAVNGGGNAPNPAPIDKVRPILLGERIVDAVLTDDGSGRTLVHRLVFESGAAMRVCPSTKGACVFLLEEST